MPVDAHSYPTKLRVAWVSQITPDTLDTVTWLNTTHELRAQGVDVTLITMGPENDQPYPGVEVVSIPRPDIYFMGQMLYHLNALRYIIRQNQPYDIVMFHQISAIWLLPLKLMGKRRPLLIMDTRDLLDFGNPTLKGRLRGNYERFIHWLAPYFLDGQTAITPRLAQLVKIPPEKLWGIWPSGVDPDEFALTRAQRVPRKDGEPIRLIYIGVFLEQRNLLPLAKAVKRANEAGMDFVLTLYGDGAFRPELETFAAGTNGGVIVERPIPYEDIPAALAKADIGVTSLPSPDNIKYEASSPLKLFEYMAAGLPVLSTSNRCHTDVVEDGHYAFWAAEATEQELFKALQQAWDARDRLTEQGQEAYQAVDAWTWAASARKLHQAFKYGLQRSPSAALPHLIDNL